MNTTRQPACCGLRFLCLAAALVCTACTGGGISSSSVAKLEEQVRRRGLIVGFEGLQPFSGYRIENLTRKVAEDLDLAQAASSGGHSDYMPLLVSTHGNGQPIYIVGYSLGGIEARNLAHECREKDIPVEILFLLDPGAAGSFSGKIPSNVRKVVFYLSGSYGDSIMERPDSQLLEAPGFTRVKFESEPTLSHMNLPEYLADRIKAEIVIGLEDWAASAAWP